MKKYLNKILIVFIALLFMAGGYWGVKKILIKDSKEDYIMKKLDENKINDLSEMEVIDLMHQMANTKVIADEKWGEREINSEIVDKLIKVVENSYFEDKETLLQILHKWRNNDFTQADKDHNFLWEKLGGTVGKARGVKP